MEQAIQQKLGLRILVKLQIYLGLTRAEPVILKYTSDSIPPSKWSMQIQNIKVLRKDILNARISIKEKEKEAINLFQNMYNKTIVKVRIKVENVVTQIKSSISYPIDIAIKEGDLTCSSVLLQES